jgi:tight adherence protein C
LLASVMAFVAVFALLIGLLALKPFRVALAAPLQGPIGQPERAPSMLQELDGSFQTRVVAPLLAPLGALLQRCTPAGAAEQLELKLDRAGRPGGMGARHFIALRFVSAVASMAVAAGCFMMVPASGWIRMAAAGFVGLIALLIPDYWLQSKINARGAAIRKALPDGLDILVACTEAGLGLDQSLQELISRRPGPLSEEFGRVLNEVNLGKPRQEAWRSLARRVAITDLQGFAAAIHQAEELGTSIAATLRVQAQTIRMRRTLYVRELAQKLPIKMLFPLIFFIFPSLFVVILGPAAVQIYRTLITGGFPGGH